MATAVEGPSADSDTKLNQEARRQAALARAIRERQRQALKLQRENILSQKTSNPARRSALEAALATIEAQLNELN